MVENTQYGFKKDNYEVKRLCDDIKHGNWIMVETAKEQLEIRITRSGKLKFGWKKKDKIKN